MKDTAAPVQNSPDVVNAVGTRWLFMVAIGPVQGFIGAARRMRDLHYGSVMLADVAQRLACKLAERHHAGLVFPSSLPPSSATRVPTRVANKLVALVLADKPEAVARDLRQTLVCCLKEIGEACKAKLSAAKVQDAVIWDAFDAQMLDALQLYAAWAPLDSEDNDAYRRAFDQADKWLDARKFTRTFSPNPVALRGWQLSSLDPSKVSVLADGSLRKDENSGGGGAVVSALDVFRNRWGVASGEQLDAIGLTKRVLGTEQGFPALARVALQPWVESWDDGMRQQLAKALAPFVSLGMARTNKCEGASPLSKLPYDCELLLSSRRTEVRRQAVRFNESKTIEALDELEQLFEPEPLEPNTATANPYDLPDDEAVYVAFLMADGDRLGQLLRAVRSSREHHRLVAEGLDKFAAQAQQLIERAGGSCFFARGDDVAAVLPADRAISLAEALRLAFTAALKPATDEAQQYAATLSVGLAYVHVLEPMGRQRALAAEALHLAKEGLEGKGMRNALGLLVQPRSGASRSWCGRWVTGDGENGTEAVAYRLKCWTQAFGHELVSRSLPYDLLNGLQTTPPGAMQAYALRILQRRMSEEDGSQTPLRNWLAQDITRHFQLSEGSEALAEVDARQRFADLLYITRWLAGHPRPAQPSAPTGQQHG